MASLCKNLRLARHSANFIGQRLGILSSNRPLLQVKSQSSTTARYFAPRAIHSLEIGDGGEPLLVYREMKNQPPAHYVVHIDSFDKFDRFDLDYLEAGIFEAGGYKWSLRIYDDVNWWKTGSKVPVKLVLADTSALPENWEFDAVVSIFLQYPRTGYYFSVLGRAFFDATKTEWSGFFSNQVLRDPCLINHKVVFGAEVFVNKKDVVTEHVTLKNFKHPPYKQEFKIPNFPSLKEDGGWVSHQVWASQVFSATGREWKLKVCPKGYEDSAGHLTIILENLPSVNAYNYTLVDVKAYFTITLKSRCERYDVEHTCSASHFKASGGDQSECVSLIDLASLYDPDKFFITDDCIHLELELFVEDDDDSETSA